MHNENAIFVKVGRIASEEVTLQRIERKCLPYVCHVTKTGLRFLDFVVNRLLSVQCNVQHWTEYKTTLASVRPSVHPSVRPVSVQTAITVNTVSSVLDRSSPNLEYSFPLTSQRKYFVSPWCRRRTVDNPCPLPSPFR